MIFCGYFIFSDVGWQVKSSAERGFYIELFLCGSEPQCDVCELTNRCCSNQEYIERRATEQSTKYEIQNTKYKIQNTNTNTKYNDIKIVLIV